jgi:hypothetical protein
VSLVGWLALGLGALIVVAVLVSIACYPRDNSF